MKQEIQGPSVKIGTSVFVGKNMGQITKISKEHVTVHVKKSGQDYYIPHRLIEKNLEKK